MAEGTLHDVRGPAALEPAARWWKRISPKLVPVFAVVTALIVSMLFMMVTKLATSGKVDVGAQLNTTGTAYSALIEGSLGVVVNNVLTADSLNLAKTYIGNTETSAREANLAARTAADVATIGMDTALRYGEVLARHTDVSDEDLAALGAAIPDIRTIGDELLLKMKPLLAGLDSLDAAAAKTLIADTAALNTLTAEARTQWETAVPAAKDLSDAELLAAAKAIQTFNLSYVQNLSAQLDKLSSLELTSTSPDAQDIAAMTVLGFDKARQQSAFAANLQALGILDPLALSNQLRVVKDLYDDELLTDENVATGLTNDLAPLLQNTLVVLRPNNQILFDHSTSPAGIIYSEDKTPDDPSDDHKPEVVYLHVGNSAFLFFPANLESMLIRAIPYIIAGLAVALTFKAGLFNIGAEGQLYIAGTLAAWVGFSPIFADLSPWIHVPLVIFMGMLGGLLWSGIAGLLKAYTGAHEVINTIMLNFVGVLLVDWLIKSNDPVILLDTASSIPRTPFVVDGAKLPTFVSLPSVLFIVAGIVTFAFGLWMRRAALRQDMRAAIRPLVYGVLVTVGGFFLTWISVRGALHIGLLIMIFMVWFTGWFLNRTTLGFELRTVGANPDAARYAGMNVAFNIFLAMALSGALAGLAGAIEISGVQFAMQPGLFGGVGFDALAVALLARSNPKNMIPAGLLWGALLAGAGLMQTRAEISIDLVKIIQALIIMFIAADAIIRFLWRVPEASAEEKEATLIASTGWGG